MDYIHRNDLISPAQLARLRERSDWRAGTHLIGHALLIALTGIALHFAWGNLWCVPVFVLHGAALNWLYAAQHEMMHHTGRAPVADVLLNTRVIRSNVFMRWLGWNMQYHCQHHLFAAVPFYRLPELDSYIGARLPQPVSYLQAFNEIRRGPGPHAAGNSVVAKANPPNADHSRQMLMENARD